MREKDCRSLEKSLIEHKSASIDPEVCALLIENHCSGQSHSVEEEKRIYEQKPVI